MRKTHLKLYRRFKRYARITEKLKDIVIPGFGGVPAFYIISFFIRGMLNENVNVRASAIAFNFFLALFPSLIFLFTLIPYMPIQALHDEIFMLFQRMLPENAYLTIAGVLEDLLQTRRGGLLSVGFFFALFFATNGIASLMDAFNKRDPRPFWKKRMIAAGLTVGVSLLIIVGISITIFGELILDVYIGDRDRWMQSIFNLFQWIVIVILVFTTIILIYYFASFPRRPPRLFISGTILASILSIIASLGFAFYVENYALYHKFYGSIGTIIVMMLWFYFQSIVLLLGYELNHSILMARDSLFEEKPPFRNDQ